MPINLRAGQHNSLHYQDIVQNGFHAFHEPIGGQAIWNGQMENGPDSLAEGWELDGYLTGSAPIRMAGGVSGNFVLRGGDAAAARGGSATSLKYISVNVDRTYILEFSAKADAVSTDHLLLVYALCYDVNKTYIAGTRVVDQWRNIPTTWTRIVRGLGASCPVKFQANTAYIRFRFYLSAGAVNNKFVYLDDVVLRQLPEEQERVNSVKAWATLYGAWGDGNSHVLSDWFGNLATAQIVFPCAVALTDELDWAAIQTATNDMSAVQGTVLIDAGIFLETRPLVIPVAGAVTIKGAGWRATYLRKTTNTVGPGPNRLARAGAVTDTMNVDAVVILDHADNDYTYYVQIEDIDIASTVSGTWGIYAPRLGYAVVQRIFIHGVNIGIQLFSSFLTTWKRLTMAGIAAGASGYGFYVANDGSGIGGGTSYDIAGCYAKEVRYGFYMYGCSYSTLKACGADAIGQGQSPGISYSLPYCGGMAVLGCGTESVLGETLYLGGSSVPIVVDGFRASAITGFSSSYGTVHLVGGRVSFTGCYWSALVGGAQYNELYNTSGGVAPVVTWDSCIRPSGGTQNYHVANDDIITVHDLRGWATAITSGVAFQILHVWNRNVLAAGSSYYEGSITGWLTVSASARVTTGTRCQVSRQYLLTVWAWSNTALTASIQQVGVDNTEGVAFTSVVVAVRAGATLTDLYLDVTVTWANPDNTNNVVYWTFVPQGGVTQNTLQMEAGL